MLRKPACLLLAILPVLFVTSVGAETLYVLTPPTTLLRFNSNAPGTILGGVAITGLANTAGETLVGIDFRPATRGLFAFSADSAGAGRTYRIHPVTGVRP